jgi:hypothetical protein
LRILAAFGLAFALITATAAQEKKDPVPPAKSDEKKAADPKTPEVKKDVAAPAADNPANQYLAPYSGAANGQLALDGLQEPRRGRGGALFRGGGCWIAARAEGLPASFLSP